MGPRHADLFGVVNFFDHMFVDFEKFFREPDFYDCRSLFREGVYDGFPPADIFVEKDKTLNFEFAVAGYNEEDINLDFDGNYMELHIEGKSKDREDVRALRNGIKKAEVRSKYYVPVDKYDYANAVAELKNGLLKVKIPSKEPKEAHKITINKV